MERSEEATPGGIRDGGKCWGPLSLRSDRGRPPPGLTRGAAVQPGGRRHAASALCGVAAALGPGCTAPRLER